MKISEFAKAHKTTQDTIRHYLELGLLITRKNGGQYNFGDADSDDLQRIIELKKLNFSLSDIKKVMTFQRISGTNTESFRKLYLSLLEEKQKDVSSELSKYNKINTILIEKILNIKTEVLKESSKLGYPLSSLHLLVCPFCNKSLKIFNGTIESNNVIEANIQCECGYEAVIKDGIFVNKNSVRRKLLNGKKMPSKEEYLENSSYEYNNFLYKGMASLIEYIEKYGGVEPEYILEMDNCVGFFLLQYIKYLPSNSTYILADYDIDRITQLKTDLELHYEHKNFIFLCCDLDNLPLKKSCMDVLIDFLMSGHFEENNGKSLLDLTLPLLKQNGILVASYLYTTTGLKTMDSKNKFFHKDIIIKNLKYDCLNQIDSSDIGPVIKENSNSSEINGTEFYQTTYISNKNK